jgi:hypothetical protein
MADSEAAAVDAEGGESVIDRKHNSLPPMTGFGPGCMLKRIQLRLGVPSAIDHLLDNATLPEERFAIVAALLSDADDHLLLYGPVPFGPADNSALYAAHSIIEWARGMAIKQLRLMRDNGGQVTAER